MCSLGAGVNLTLVSTWTLACNRANMLAPDGRCKTLDAAADGYVRAEAAGCAILVAAPAAQGEGGSQACALLAGTAVNQDGRSSSLTAPNGPSQQLVIRAALADAGLQPHGVAALEMHGTGGGAMQLHRLNRPGGSDWWWGMDAWRAWMLLPDASPLHPPVVTWVPCYLAPLQAHPWGIPLKWVPLSACWSVAVQHQAGRLAPAAGSSR
jgi:hypothetical protein